MKRKLLCIIEISIVFSLAIILFRFVSLVPTAMRINASLDSLLFAQYAVLLIIAIPAYMMRCRSQSKTTLLERLNYQAKIFTQGFFPFFLLSVLLSWINWRQWTGAILISLIEIGLLFWFAWLARHTQPAWRKGTVGSSVILLPVLAQFQTKLAHILVAFVYFYLFVALSEEALFRGYFQTRLNEAFGRPKRLFGISWGLGLIVTSVLFGIWHLGWGNGTGTWPHVLWTLFAGLMLGIVREKGGGLIAPTLLHGIINYGPQAILFHLFFA